MKAMAIAGITAAVVSKVARAISVARAVSVKVAVAVAVVVAWWR
jgi:hypothetical protein